VSTARAAAPASPPERRARPARDDTANRFLDAIVAGNRRQAFEVADGALASGMDIRATHSCGSVRAECQWPRSRRTVRLESVAAFKQLVSLIPLPMC